MRVREWRRDSTQGIVATMGEELCELCYPVRTHLCTVKTFASFAA